MKKPHLEWKLLGSALLLASLFDLLFWKTNQVGINVLLMQGAFIAVLFGITHYTGKKITTKSLIASIFALTFAGTFAIWTSELGLMLSGIGLFASNIFLLLYLFGHHGHFTHPAHIASTTIIAALEATLGRLQFFNHLRLPKKRVTLSGSVVKGILILLPIVFIFAILFVQSDLILQQKTTNIDNWFGNIGDWIENQMIIAHVFLIGFFTFAFSLIFATAFWKPIKFKDKLSFIRTHKTESVIVLAGTNFLFLAFILFQAVYLFGGQSAWEKIEGITYSEYAVQGFNELAAITALAILLVLSIRYFNSHVKNLSWLNALEIGLLAQTILIAISAWQRMSLYIAQYNFTPARLAGLWFILLSVILLALLIAHILKKTPQYKYINQALIVTAIAMLLFTASAPDALTVRLNEARATEEKPLDEIFEELSAEAYPAMIRSLESDLTNHQITDYCGYVDVHYANERAFAYTLSVNATVPDTISKQFTQRRKIADFQNNWYEKINEKKWNTWNASRSQIKINERIDTRGIPFPADQVAEACNTPTANPNPQNNQPAS